ncbi:MAG: RNA polymerase sigma factor [Deltaproteobacteria bacterium]|nr:RNA polymerase sigma factor [Deltaproteobacteria bacterium]
MAGEADDAALLVRWREGDTAAADQLVQRHFAAIYRFFAAKVGDAADELTQRVFLSCIEARDRIDPSRPLRPYLFGIARNTLLKHLRQHYTDRGRFAPDQTSIHDAGLRAGPGVVTVREEQRALHMGLARLPVDLQFTLEMYYWWGLSIGEIAQATEVPIGTVKSRLSRGRTALREQLEQLEIDPAKRERLMLAADEFTAVQRDVGPPAQ